MPEDKTSDERREDPRVKKIQLVQVTRFDEEGFHADVATGRTLNMSSGGIRLELHHALPLRSVINLGLGLGEEIIEVSGTVVYLEALDEERCAMGIRFAELSPEQEEKVREYVETHGTGG